MVELARKGFGPRIHNVFEDPRSHIVFEDAKTFFAETRQPYDIIVSEPSNPWVSGVSSLFSEEFYARVVQHLAPDGVFVQWLQIYETDMTVVASIVKALSTQFRAYTFYNLDDGDILILATPAAAFQPPDYSRLQSPQLRAALERIGVQSIYDLQTRQLGRSGLSGAGAACHAGPGQFGFLPLRGSECPPTALHEASGQRPDETQHVAVSVSRVLPGMAGTRLDARAFGTNQPVPRSDRPAVSLHSPGDNRRNFDATRRNDSECVDGSRCEREPVCFP